MSGRATWGNTPARLAEHFSRFGPSENPAVNSAIERLARADSHARAVEGNLGNRQMAMPVHVPVLQTRENEGRASTGPTAHRVQPAQRPRSPLASGAALDATAGARRPQQGARSRGPEVEPSSSPNRLSRQVPSEVGAGISPGTSISSIPGLEPRKTEALPQGRLSPSSGSTVSGSTSPQSQVPTLRQSLGGRSNSRSEISLGSEGMNKHLPSEYIRPGSPSLHAVEADLDGINKHLPSECIRPGSPSLHAVEADLDHTSKSNPLPTQPASNKAPREAFAERLSEKPAPAWARESQVRDLREEQARQAHMLAAAESRLGEEIGTLKESVAAEASRCEQMEARLNKRCAGLVEEEAAVRRAVESHLEARLMTLRSDIMTAVRTELEAYAKDFAVTRAAVDECARRAAAAAVAVEPAARPGARDSDEEAGEEGKKEVLEKLEHQGRRSRSPKKRLLKMQPLQEQPDKEHLARLDEAVSGFHEAMEREMKSRSELEQRLQGQLQAVSAQVQAAMAMMQSVCVSLRKEELKLQDIPAKHVQPLALREMMAKATLKTSDPGLDPPGAAAPGDPQPETETPPEGEAPESARKQTGEQILRMLAEGNSEQTDNSRKSLTGTSTHSLSSVFSASGESRGGDSATLAEKVAGPARLSSWREQSPSCCQQDAARADFQLNSVQNDSHPPERKLA